MSVDGAVLAVESATRRVGCALAVDGELVGAVHDDAGRRHAESLAPQIEGLLTDAGLRPADLRLVGVDVGPGLYTGLRVGLMTARTLASLVGAPLVGVSSLDAVAHGARGLSGELTVVLDARRGEVYHARYTATAHAVEALTEPHVVAPEHLAEVLAPGTVLVGDGAAEHASVFTDAGHRIGPPEHELPSPADLVALTLQRAGDAGDPATIAPLYLRRPDAVAKWDTAS